MSIHKDAQLRQLIEQFGGLKRYVAHLEGELTARTEQHCQLAELPYSNEENDKRIEDIGLSDETVRVLRKNDVFKVSQILNLGSFWITATREINFLEINEIRMCLADLGIALPD